MIAECVNVLKVKQGHALARIGVDPSILDQAEQAILKPFHLTKGDEIVVVVKKARPISTVTSPNSAAAAANKGGSTQCKKVEEADLPSVSQSVKETSDMLS